MTRLFVAAWPPRDLANRLAHLAHDAGEVARLVPVDQLHVTLRFLGDANAEVVTERLRGAELTGTHARLGPAVSRLGARGLIVPVHGADELAAAVRDATAGLGQPSPHDFVGHITLARTAAHTTIEGRPVDGSFPLDDIRLVESEVGPTGSVYTTVARVPSG